MKSILLAIVILTSCTVRIVQYVNEDADFATFDDYILIGLKGKNVSQSDASLDILPRIESAINAEMGQKNYHLNKNEPDLIVRYEIVSGTVSQNNQNTGRYGFGGMVPVYNYRNVIESVLLIEILNASNQKLVWQASMDLKDHSRKTKRKDVLKSAVERLFDSYQYEAGSNQKIEL
jgi:hypothetical protein